MVSSDCPGSRGMTINYKIDINSGKVKLHDMYEWQRCTSIQYNAMAKSSNSANRTDIVSDPGVSNGWLAVTGTLPL